MTLTLAWFVFPLLLVLLCIGTGLLVERIAGAGVPTALVLPSGLSVIVVVGSLTVSLPSTAKLTTPLVAALAAAGFVLSRRRRRPDSWAIGSSTLAYLCYGAPVLASGTPTFAGYVKLDDTATFLALADRILDHGRNLAGLPPSTYEATLGVNLAHGYPLGSLLPLAIGHQLVRTDLAWLYQPWLSFCAAVLALCLYQLAAPLIRSRPLRAAAAFVAAQSALLYGYALWGGVKELAATALVATAAALTATLRPPYHARRLVPFAIACAAILDTLSVAGVVWLVPLTIPLLLLLRRAPAVVAAGLGAVAVLALPALATVTEFLRGANRATFESGAVLGNLFRALRPLQIMGIWPNGDFRADPHARTAAALLIAVAVAAALVGVILAVRSNARSLLLAIGSVLTGAVVFVLVGAPWVGAKALAIGSPFVLLTALCACVGLAPHVRGPGRRTAVAVGATAAAALVAGVVWSDALAYHDADLAPRGQLLELERIGDRFAGQGPALMTEYQPYGVRHFLRRVDPEGVSELRRRPIPLRNGRVTSKADYVDLDQIDLSALLVYRTLVIRRSPTESRPPAPYELAQQGRWYEVWQRESRAIPLEHVPLGGPLEAAAVPSCAQVHRLAARGRLLTAPRPLNVVWPLNSTRLPGGWSAAAGGAVLPGQSGTLPLAIALARTARYQLWVGGSVRGKLTASVDGNRVGSASSQLQNAGQWLDLGSVQLSAGTHSVSLAVSLSPLRPGTGGDGFPLGPLLLQPQAPAGLIAPSRVTTVCGRPLDWLEAEG
jgi:hypothetical protein